MTPPRFLAIGLMVGTVGCLLPERPAPPRLFAPVTTPHLARPGATGVTVRIRPVQAPLHLREPMAWRRGDAEFGQYEQRLWTELPATYVERTLGDALAADGIEVTSLGDAPTLSIELRRFEELLSPTHEAVVELEVGLAVAGRTRVERRVTAREPIADDEPASVAYAMGRALDTAANEVSRTVRMQTGAERSRGSAPRPSSRRAP
jgi:ABC-type uncharacterized transport system auxiliary subunit